MKNIIIIFSILFSTLLFAQERKSKSIDNQIKIVAQYIDGVGMELRWFPNSRALFKMGQQNGYELQRAEYIPQTKQYSAFQTIQTIKPYTKEQWKEVIRKNPKKENNLRELASEYIEDQKEKRPERIIFKGDASELKKMKDKQDNEYTFLTLMTFQDKEVALGAGLGAIDKTAERGKKYLYRVVVKTSGQPSQTHLQNIVCRATSVEAVQLPKPGNKSIGIIENDSALTIIWEDIPSLVGYYIERSERKNAHNYTPLTKAPLIFLKGEKFKGKSGGAFKDEQLQNGKEYYYKIYANTLFGDKVLVGQVKGTPKDLTPPKTPGLKIPEHDKDKVKLTWYLQGEPDADLKGFDVLRSDKNDGKYVKLNRSLLPKNSRTFEDKNYSKEHANYYKVIAYDRNDNASASAPAYAVIIDETPPEKPKGMVANISKDGVVQIVIPKQKDKDIIGYKIFKANQKDHEFSVVEEVFPSGRDYLFKEQDKMVFEEKIPLKTLTSKMYYKVKMYDRNFNQSEFSDVIEIEKPDIVPPASAVIKSYKINFDNVAIEIIKPESKDLKTVNLYRKTNEKDWKLIHSFPANKEEKVTYIDRKIEPNTQYYYRVQAVDNHRLTSGFSSALPVKTLDFKTISPVKGLKASKKGKYVQLNWNYKGQNKDLFFVIYRKINEGSFKQIGHSSNEYFIDKRPKKGTIQYAVKAMTINGNTSGNITKSKIAEIRL